jgi:FG-GAP-like repeat
VDRLPLMTTVLLSLAMTGCAQIPSTAADSGPAETAQINDFGPAVDASACDKVVCKSGHWCHIGRCILKQAPCKDDGACINDTRCVNGTCLPWGAQLAQQDSTCSVGVKPFAASALKAPVFHCSWTGGNVMMTPVVADLNGDGKPEILFVNGESSALVAIKGSDCSTWFNITAGLASRSQLAVADLTGDKVPEIVGVTHSGKVAVFSATGSKLTESDQAAKTLPTKYIDGGPAIANVDGKGPPEIVYAGLGLRYDKGKLTTLYNVEVEGGHWGVLSALADVDLDGVVEVLVGNKILDGLTGKDETPAPVKGFSGGYVAVAQFDTSTPEPEIVLISSPGNAAGTLRVYHPVSGAVVFGPYSTGTFWGGPPTVADFDGDGRPEVAVAGYDAYLLFDPDCDGSPPPPGCAAPGVRWKRKTQDISSGSTGSSVFDFNGDGKPEVIYRDECWLRVYDGTTGKVRFAASAYSGTILDMPVVADLEGDGHADLVLPTTTGLPMVCPVEADLQLLPTPQDKGVHVLQDPDNRWMSSRPLWNQHTYHVTNINDDLTVPLVEPYSWLGDNSFRKNVQGAGQDKQIPGPDLTAQAVPAVDPTDGCKTWTLQARVCNRGDSWVGAGINGTFYLGPPTTGGGKAICSGQTKAALRPGQCGPVSCLFKSPPAGKIDLWFVADRDGAGTGSVDECREGNNALNLPGYSCSGVE